MKTPSSIGGLILLLAFSSSVLASPELPPNSMRMSQLLQKMQKEGFTVIKIEFDDGKYLAKAINNSGENVKLEIAPQSGEILKPVATERSRLSINDAAQKVEQTGYHSIFFINSTENKYEFKAYDKNNKNVSLDVDAKTGKIKN